MTRSPTWLLDHASDVYSQTGEDGILSQALSLLPERDRWCVEFGAYDAMSISNTRNLVENHAYSCVLIEGNKTRYGRIEREYRHNPRVTTINAMVGWTNDDSLDFILRAHDIPKHFDFLSIDIDGNDFHVWQATTELRPKLVCIEFNPTIPTEVNFVQVRDPNVTQGASLSALTELGKSKGYALIAVLRFNAFFVDERYFAGFDISNNDPRLLRTKNDDVTHLFTGYDGTVHLTGGRTLPWHEVTMRESRLQVLPRPLRKYPHNYNKFETLLFAVYLLLSSPNQLLIRWRRRRRKGPR